MVGKCFPNYRSVPNLGSESNKVLALPFVSLNSIYEHAQKVQIQVSASPFERASISRRYPEFLDQSAGDEKDLEILDRN